MAKPYTNSQFSSLLTFLLSISRVYSIDAAGFTVDLVPRDSILSPALSPEERIRNSQQRSFRLAALLLSNNSTELASTDVVSDGGAFLMKFSIGTPPVTTLAIADTGSDLTWIQCKPCHHCYKQKLPLFDPTRSSSYKPVPCRSTTCTSVVSSIFCGGSRGTCGFGISYGDWSTAGGDLSTETVSIGGLSVPNFIFGCGHSDWGKFSSGSAGVVGLGGGKESLITQLSSSIEGKFSYCLARWRSGKMNFGEHAVVSGADVVTTPLVPKSPETFYYLTLEGITVGFQRLDYFPPPSSSFGVEGNIIIDSGTTLTLLPPELYEQVEAEVKRQVKAHEIKDPWGLLNVCYEAAAGAGGLIKVPQIVVHFRGADVKLSGDNSFLRRGRSTVCLAFAPTKFGFAIYGNIAQSNFLVGYDLGKKTVSFKPADCAKV